MREKEKELIAVWGISKTRNDFGSLLMFLAEVQAMSYKYKRIDIAYIGVGDHAYLFMSVMNFFSDIRNILFFSSIKEFRRYERYVEADLWPNKVEGIDNTSFNGSTIFLCKIYGSNQNTKRLTTPKYIKSRMIKWLGGKYDNHKLVVVHLKNNPNDSKSNANQNNWYNFMVHIVQKYHNIKFVVIGNDEIDVKISSLSNVILTKESGGNTELDISLVLSAFIFLGMSSGPCNAAIFSDTPYIIWKHPDHHIEEMNRELGDKNSFLFARKNQVFLREYDTLDSLINNFDKIYYSIC